MFKRIRDDAWRDEGNIHTRACVCSGTGFWSTFKLMRYDSKMKGRYALVLVYAYTPVPKFKRVRYINEIEGKIRTGA